MTTQTATLFTRAALRFFSLVLFAALSHLALAVEETLTVHCPETSLGSQIYNLEECEVIEGRVTNTSIIDLSADLLDLLDKDPQTDFSSASSDCSIVNGEISCKVGTFNLDMNCEVSTNTSGQREINCGLKTNPQAPAIPEAFFTMGCNEATGQCTVSSNSDILSDLLDSGIPGNGRGDNLGAIADSLLSCVSRNTFTSFQNICDKIIGTLQQPGGADLVLAFIESIQPLNPDASTDTSITTIRQALTNLGQRLRNIRTGGAVASNHQPLRYFDGQQWLQAGDLVASNSAAASDAREIEASSKISDYGRLSLFINGAAIATDQSGDDVETGSETDSTILTLGVDYRFTDQLVAGLAFNLGHSDTDFDVTGYRDGSLDTDSHMFTLFGTYYTNQWFIDGSFSLGGDSYEQERQYECNSTSGAGCLISGKGVAEANYHSSQTIFSISSGYDWSYKSFSITPYAQYLIGQVDVDSYSERSKDSAILAIEIDEQTKDISTLNLGANFQYVIATSRGVVIPSASLQMVQEFEDDTQFITGRFVGNKSNGSDFRLTTNEVDSSYALVGIGCSLQLKNGQAGFINIQTAEGYENIDQTRLTLGWRWEI